MSDLGAPKKRLLSSTENPAICVASSQAESLSAALICFFTATGIVAGSPKRR